QFFVENTFAKRHTLVADEHAIRPCDQALDHIAGLSAERAVWGFPADTWSHDQYSRYFLPSLSFLPAGSRIASIKPYSTAAGAVRYTSRSVSCSIFSSGCPVRSAR